MSISWAAIRESILQIANIKKHFGSFAQKTTCLSKINHMAYEFSSGSHRVLWSPEPAAGGAEGFIYMYKPHVTGVWSFHNVRIIPMFKNCFYFSSK